MPWPSRFELACLVLALGAAQLAIAVRFLRRLRAAPAEPPGGSFRPRVAVLVPCAGRTPGFAENVRRLLDQDFGGQAEYLFVCPSELDASYAALGPLLACAPRAARRLASGLRPERSSGKIADLLHALASVPDDAELLVFADADLRVPRHWLSALVAPLAEPAAGIATAAMLYIPARLGLGPLLRLAWMAYGMPYFAATGGVSGQSCALRREDFEALGIARLWSGSFLEDLALARRARAWDKRVVFVPRAIPYAPDAASFREMLSVFNKWMLAYRVYDPRTWALGAAVTAFKTLVLLDALRPPFGAGPLALLFAADAATLFVLVAGLRAALPDRFESSTGPLRLTALAAALCAPLLQAVHLANYLFSAFAREVDWGPYRYRVRGPQEVVVVAGPGGSRNAVS